MRGSLVVLCLAAATVAFTGPALARKRHPHPRHYHQRLIPSPYPQAYGGASRPYTPGVPSGNPPIYQPISPSGSPQLRQPL